VRATDRAASSGGVNIFIRHTAFCAPSTAQEDVTFDETEGPYRQKIYRPCAQLQL